MVIVQHTATPITDIINKISIINKEFENYSYYSFGIIFSELFLFEINKNSKILYKSFIKFGLIVKSTPKKLKIRPITSLELIYSLRKSTLIINTKIGAIYYNK